MYNYNITCIYVYISQVGLALTMVLLLVVRRVIAHSYFHLIIATVTKIAMNIMTAVMTFNKFVL